MTGWMPCCCSCVTADDLFERDNSTDIGSEWDECSGDWEIDDGHLTVDETDAIAVWNGPTMGLSPGGHSVGILDAELHIFEPPGIPSPPGFSSVDGKYRLLAFYGDAISACTPTSYWMLELEVLTNVTGKLRLYDPSSTLIGERDMVWTGQFTNIKLCVSETMITGTSDDLSGGPLIWTVHEDAIEGIYFALGCGNTTQIYFEKVHYSDQWDHDHTCPDCSEPCCCPEIEAEDKQPDMLVTIDCSGSSMDGATTTLSCSALPGECCAWSGDDIEFSCDGANDGGLTYSLNVDINCLGGVPGCEHYQLHLTWPTGSTNHTWCYNEEGESDKTVTANAGCTCDPLSLTFGPFQLKNPGTVPPGPGYCDCCEEYYLVVTEAP